MPESPRVLLPSDSAPARSQGLHNSCSDDVDMDALLNDRVQNDNNNKYHCKSCSYSYNYNCNDVPGVQAWRWSRSAEHCGVPQLQFWDKLDMPVVVNDRCSELIVDSSATDHGGNRGSFQRVQGAAVYGGLFGVSAVGWGFWAFFSRSSGRPGVSASFFEPSSTHTCECSRAPAN